MTASYIKFFYCPVQRQTCQHSKTISLIEIEQWECNKNCIVLRLIRQLKEILCQPTREKRV